LTNLITEGGKITPKERKLIKNFYEFLNPFNSEASIKPLLKYLLKLDRGKRDISLPMLPDLFNPSDVKPDNKA
jgi:sulfur relay (sulfurtransferase) DsrC/TusE family protein